MNFSVCGNDFDLSEPPKTAPNPFSVSSARCGRVSDMRENHSVEVEPEPVSVQVVERVGLVASSFQFFTRLAAVFAEEVGGFAYECLGRWVTRTWSGKTGCLILLRLQGLCRGWPDRAPWTTVHWGRYCRWIPGFRPLSRR